MNEESKNMPQNKKKIKIQENYWSVLDTLG